MRTSEHKNILLLTPVYPGSDVHKSTTPVVHYFTREWVKMGHNVKVVHYPVNFSQFVYFLAKPFKEKIGTIMGSEVRTWALEESEYDWENIHVKRIPMTKFRPHCRYSKRQIDSAVKKTIAYCRNSSFVPDVIIAHWVNPTFEIMHHLKKYFNVPTCFISHDTGTDLDSIYRNEAAEYISETDVIGYRSDYIRKSFESKFACADKKNFLCSSGIPASYLKDEERNISDVRNFVFVGTLLKRKYPAEIIPAVYKAYGSDDFSINYIGVGEETKNVEKYATQFGIQDKVRLLGFLKRDDVVKELDKNEVFVMISKNETFGLVYLEAMARGCITIAARKEGFDGIIKDGENGFLCEAGNVNELASIIKRLRNMTSDELNMISYNARKTAENLTDVKAAATYMSNIEKYCFNANN